MAMPFLLVVLSILGVRLIDFKPSSSPDELRVAAFTPETIDLRERQPADVSGLKSPFEIVSPDAKVSPSIPLSAVAPESLKGTADIGRPLELKVSVIVVTESRRMAIVSGLVVKEGDALGKMRITRIEKERILVTDLGSQDKEQGKRWIYLEGVK